MAHIHGVYDTDTHFSIDPLSRQLKYESEKLPGIVQHDHNSQVLTFEVPRYTMDGHDMSLCDKVRVHYINTDPTTKEKKTGLYDVTDLQVAADDDNVVLCSWPISRNATQLVGGLAFALRLACTENGEEVYGLSTVRYDKLTVSGGVNNDEVIVEEYADILDQWEARIEALEQGGTGGGSGGNVDITGQVERAETAATAAEAAATVAETAKTNAVMAKNDAARYLSATRDSEDSASASASTAEKAATRAEEAATRAEEAAANADNGSGGNVDLTGVVKSVNGVTPDENGNVEIAVSGGNTGVAVATSALTMQVVGQLFNKPEDRAYVAWPLGNVQYDPNDDTVNVLVNVADTHDMTNDENVPDLYLFKMNPHSMAYTLEPIVKDGAVVNQTNADEATFVPGTKCAYTFGFCIDSNGDYLFMPNYCSETYLFRSSDHGASWAVTVCNMDGRNSTTASGLMQTSTGRLIVSTQHSYFWYSDDDGANWTKCATPTTHNYGHEACIVELAENELLAVMRKRWQSTDNDAWNGTREIDPAFICYSHDNGETWTEGVDSTTITEMSATGCAIAKIGDRLELYATSRYPHLDTYGVIYQHTASAEDAMVDNWSNGKVLTYSKAKSYDDFGYPGCCVDANGNVHLFWYDGDADESGNTNYYYAQGYSGVCNVPVNADHMATVSNVFPYSAAMVKQLIDSAVAKLNAKINQIIIEGGGTPENGELDGTFYVTDGLYDYVNFLDEGRYDATSCAYSGVKEKLSVVARATVDNFDPAGLVGIGQCETDLSEDLSFANGVTFEIDQYVGDVIRTNNATHAIAFGNVSYPTPGVCNDLRLNISDGGWKTTDGASGTSKYLGTTVTPMLYATGKKYIHIVLTMTDTEYAIYADGKCVNSGAFADTVSDFGALAQSGVTSFYIGGSGLLTDSHLRYFRAYNRVLTADEVQNNYKYQKALRE